MAMISCGQAAGLLQQEGNATDSIKEFQMVGSRGRTFLLWPRSLGHLADGGEILPHLLGLSEELQNLALLNG